MTTYADRILLNAEPFGFGPAAAIASIAALLSKKHVRVGYMGEGHTHNLQDGIAYEDRYDLSDMSPSARQTLWNKAAKKYQFFMTAMDFQAAEAARAAGMRVIIYDALAWYWPSLPGIIKEADLYLAQNFFGVQKRSIAEASPHTPTKLVPPIVAPTTRVSDDDLVLLNMGGLQNPLWNVADAVAYADTMVRAVRSALPKRKVIIATSRLVAEALSDPAVKTYGPQEMQRLLLHAKQAIMTPGLGNIYDAAAYNLPTVWLPPANDSQARQLQLLIKHHCYDAAVSWKDVGQRIDLALPQPQVMRAISESVGKLQANPLPAQQLESALRQSVSHITNQTGSRCYKLLQLFGSQGTESIAREVIAFMKSPSHVSI